MSKIIDGRSISTAVKARVAKGVLDLKERGIDVGLAVIIVGNNPASKVYIANKKKACEELGIISEEYALPESTTEEQLLELIAELNGKKSINGILCQLPLPSHIDEKRVIDSISPEKDVDAFHPHNVGRIMIGDYDFVPCTPAGIMEMLEYEGIDVEGKKCVVIGRSNIVGKPMGMLLLHKSARCAAGTTARASHRAAPSRPEGPEVGPPWGEGPGSPSLQESAPAQSPVPAA